MYAETLEVPHYLKCKPNQLAKPLLSVIDLDAIRHQLAITKEISDTETYSAAKIEVAEAITKEVNRALWYPEKLPYRDDYELLDVAYPIGLNEIEQKQAASCFGYTYVTSELLTEAEVEHWVAYGNGHAFLLLPTVKNDTEQIYFVDPLLPHLNHHIDSSMRRGNVSSIRGDLKKRQRTAFMLDTYQFCHELGASTDNLPRRHPWLIFDKGEKQVFQDYRDVYFSGSDTEERDRLQRKFMIIVSAYEAVVGRKMIQEYVGFQQAITNTDVPGACRNLRELSGLYPELDARNEHTELRQIIDSLCGSGQIHVALQLVELYFQNFEEVSTDSRLYVSKGDCLRSVASSCGSTALAVNLIAEAEDQYRQAVEKPKSFREQIQGKIQRAQEERDQVIASTV